MLQIYLLDLPPVTTLYDTRDTSYPPNIIPIYVSMKSHLRSHSWSVFLFLEYLVSNNILSSCIEDLRGLCSTLLLLGNRQWTLGRRVQPLKTEELRGVVILPSTYMCYVFLHIKQIFSPMPSTSSATTSIHSDASWRDELFL